MIRQFLYVIFWAVSVSFVRWAFHLSLVQAFSILLAGLTLTWLIEEVLGGLFEDE